MMIKRPPKRGEATKLQVGKQALSKRLRRLRSRQRHGGRQQELLEKSSKDRHGARERKNETKETGTGKLKETSYEDLVHSNKAMMMQVKFYSTLLQSNILDLCSRTRGLGGNTPSKATHTDLLCYSSRGDVHYVLSSSRVSVAIVPILQSSYAIVSGDGSGGWVVRGKYRCRRVWTWGS